MTLSQRAIEAAARAIDKLDHRKATSMANLTRMMAEAALTAALAVDGVALVPKEPTQEMLGAALALDAVSHGVLVPAGPADVWAAMIAAANDGEELSPPPDGTDG